MAPRIEQLTIRNLRSIGDSPVTLRFPTTGVLALVGENNAGKSNITRALDLLFGDTWPGSRQLDEHDFHGRDSDGIAVEVNARVTGMTCPYCSAGEITHLTWKYDPQANDWDGSAAYRQKCQLCNKTFPKRETRSQLASTTVNADRRLDYQLSYASKWTMLSRLMHRFHERLLADPARKQRLESGFAQLVSEFEGVEQFASFQALLAGAAEDFGQSLPYRLDIDFAAYDPSNFFRSLRVHPTFSGEVRSFDELGTGQEQILALAFAYAYAKAYGESEGIVLVIDEPEANLHPLAQQWLARSLNSLATDGLQIVVTTHSPHFVDLAKPENIVLVSKDDAHATQVVQRPLADLVAELVARGADAERTTTDSVGPFYAASATTEIVTGLFARRCVLVEGATEALALPELLRHQGVDVLRQGVAVIAVDGLGNLAKWYRLFSALGIDTYCIFDTDSDKTGADATQLAAKREDLLTALGEDPTQSLVVPTSALLVTTRFAAFNPNFESACATLFGDAWLTAWADAKELVGDSKPLRGRYAAAQVADAASDDARLALELLARTVAIEKTNPTGMDASDLDETIPF